MTQSQQFPDDAIEFRFVLASGPGGQHVNKTSTAVELRADVERLRLPTRTLTRLYEQQANRINKEGTLVIQASQFRSQLKHRADALTRLRRMIAEAGKRAKVRIPTKPSKNAQRKRLDSKRKRGDVKSQRKRPDP